jgi:hypothetical protein
VDRLASHDTYREGHKDLLTRSVTSDQVQKDSGYTAGVEAPTAALNCVLRSGHGIAEKKDMLQQLWSMFQHLTGIADDQLAISLQEIPSSNAMEMGQIMPAVGQE